MLHIVSFLELVYTAACVNELLLACKEGVALIADIHLESVNILGGTRFKCFAAGAYNRYLMIFGMYIGLHFIHPATTIQAKALDILMRAQSSKKIDFTHFYFLYSDKGARPHGAAGR